MSRKVIEHGTSLAISLPAPWVKAQGITKGDDIDVIIGDEGLLIKPGKRRNETKHTHINCSNLNKTAWQALLLTLHHKGYDEITMTANDEQARDIRTYLDNQQLGMEILSQQRENILLGSMASNETDKFDSLFRRVYIMTQEYMNKVVAIMKNKEDYTESCDFYKNSIPRIANHCRRIIINEHKKDAAFHYAIIEHLEILAEKTNNLLQDVIEHDIDEQDIKGYEALAKLLADAQKLQYDYSLERYNAFMEATKKAKPANSKFLCSYESIRSLTKHILAQHH